MADDIESKASEGANVPAPESAVSPAVLLAGAPSRLRRIGRLLLRATVFLICLGAAVGTAALILKPSVHLRGNGVLPDVDLVSKDKRFDRLERSRAERAASVPDSQTRREDLAQALALPGWPGFRGAGRDGLSSETGLMKSWPAGGPPMLYKQPVGLGWGSFAIGLGRAYTLEQRRDDEVVACYDFATGAELWVVRYPAAFSESMGGDGPRSTPTLDGDRLFALGAMGDFHCLNALSGDVIWKTNVVRETGAENLKFGIANSPLIHEGKVYVTGADALLGYDTETGKLIIRGPALRQAYSSLTLVRLAGRDQFLNLAADSLNGLDPGTGAILWSHPWKTMGGNNISQPIPLGADRVFVAAGYDQGSAAVQIKAGDAGALSAEPVWSNRYLKNKLSSSILIQGNLYGLDEGIMACVDAESGKRLWKKGRFGHGQLILADGRLIVISEDGELVLIEPSPRELIEVSRAPALDGKTWNVPALADGRLLVRNDKEMACFDLRETIARPPGP